MCSMHHHHHHHVHRRCIRFSHKFPLRRISAAQPLETLIHPLLILPTYVRQELAFLTPPPNLIDSLVLYTQGELFLVKA